MQLNVLTTNDRPEMVAVVLEAIQFPGDEQVYVSLLEANKDGLYFTLPMTVVPVDRDDRTPTLSAHRHYVVI